MKKLINFEYSVTSACMYSMVVDELEKIVRSREGGKIKLYFTPVVQQIHCYFLDYWHKLWLDDKQLNYIKEESKKIGNATSTEIRVHYDRICNKLNELNSLRKVNRKSISYLFQKIRRDLNKLNFDQQTDEFISTVILINGANIINHVQLYDDLIEKFGELNFGLRDLKKRISDLRIDARS